MSRKVVFLYRGYRFLCSAEKERPARFRPVVMRQLGWPSEKLEPLMNDADLCRTESEALRHAEQQAMHWTDSRVEVHQG